MVILVKIKKYRKRDIKKLIFLFLEVKNIVLVPFYFLGYLL